MNPAVADKSSSNGGVQLCTEQNRSSVMLFSFLPVLLGGFHHNILALQCQGSQVSSTKEATIGPRTTVM